MNTVAATTPNARHATEADRRVNHQIATPTTVSTAIPAASIATSPATGVPSGRYTYVIPEPGDTYTAYADPPSRNASAEWPRNSWIATLRNLERTWARRTKRANGHGRRKSMVDGANGRDGISACWDAPLSYALWVLLLSPIRTGGPRGSTPLGSSRVPAR